MTDTSSIGDGPKLDATIPHSARVWNYWLGGKDHFASDRQLGEQIRQFFPDIVDVARASRQFLIRAVTYLTGEVGIRQFLDIGTGLPTADNTHEVAQRVAPSSRIVYVDNDPLVLVHARALLTSSPEGVSDYIDADLHEPDQILPRAAQTLDFTRPVALMLLGILGHIVDYDEARSIVDRLVSALPSGSYLVVNDGTNVVNGRPAKPPHRRPSRPERRTSPAARRRSPATSRVSSWSIPVWSPARGGGLRPAPTESRTRWTCSVAWPASREPGLPHMEGTAHLP